MQSGSVIFATFILAAMCATMWWLARLARKRMGIGAGTISGDGLRVVGKRPLDQKTALYVIEIAGGRHILVGASADGGVAKIDDISTEEYLSMAADAPAARGRLRVAGADSPELAADANEADDATEPASQQRFATVGESFGMLLGKARDSRRGPKASGE